MRLAACLLTLVAPLVAQEIAEPAWKIVPPSLEAPAPLGAEPMPLSPRTVRMTGDGVIHVFDAKGVRLLRMGLPGRPAKVWRDGGVVVEDPYQPLHFPTDTPLRRGLGNLPLGAQDFRSALTGLLWVLDDSERHITLLHPAAARFVKIHLPQGERLDLRFHPDRLEVLAMEEAGVRRGWSLPWIALLPQYLQLGRPLPGPPPGTALHPFPGS